MLQDLHSFAPPTCAPTLWQVHVDMLCAFRGLGLLSGFPYAAYSVDRFFFGPSRDGGTCVLRAMLTLAFSSLSVFPSVGGLGGRRWRGRGGAQGAGDPAKHW